MSHFSKISEYNKQKIEQKDTICNLIKTCKILRNKSNDRCTKYKENCKALVREIKTNINIHAFIRSSSL